MLSPYLYQELCPFKNGPIRDENGASDIIQFLVEKKYLSVTDNDIRDLSIVPVEWGLTERGKSALSEYERTDEEMRKQASDKKSDRATQITSSIIGAAVGSLLTLLVQNVSQVIRFVSKLLNQ